MTKKEIFMNHATKLKGEYVMTEPSSMAAMEEYAQQQVKKLNIPDVRFQLPSDQQIIEIALLFNDGKIQTKKLSDMVAMCLFVIDRLYENGDISKRSSKEGN